jgi:hypothetical protein
MFHLCKFFYKFFLQEPEGARIILISDWRPKVHKISMDRDRIYFGLLVFIQFFNLASERVFSTSDFLTQPRPAVATP